MINKPYSLLPSDLEDGSGVIDISKDITFSFLVTGTTPIKSMGIQIGDLSGTTQTSLAYEVTPPLYYTNIDGTAKTMTMQFSSADLCDAVGTSPEQKWRVWIRDVDDNPTLSDWVFVQLKTTPSASISTASSATTKYNRWELTYTPSVTYINKVASSSSTSIRSIRWQVFDVATADTALYDSGEIYGCVEPVYDVDGLISGHTYYAQATVIDQDGVATTAVSDNVTVSYNQGASGIMALVYTDEIDDVSSELAYGHEIALDLTNFSGDSGVSSGGSDGFEIENVGSPIGFVLENKTGNVITYKDIAYDGSEHITVRMLFTPQPYSVGADVMILYLDDDETSRVRYAVTNDGGLTPSNSLTPSAMLTPSVRDYYVTAFFESLINGVWVITDSSDSTYIDFSDLIEDEFFYYEHTFSMSDAFFPDYNIYMNKPRINGVELIGDQTFAELRIEVIEPLSDIEIDAGIGW